MVLETEGLLVLQVQAGKNLLRVGPDIWIVDYSIVSIIIIRDENRCTGAKLMKRQNKEAC